MLIHAKRLENFTMRATDGELGLLEDFYVDRHTLKLRYFVGNTRTWFFGGKVLLSPNAFMDVDVEDLSIAINATKKQIKDSPKPEDQAPIHRDYEKQLNDHYGWPTYWNVPAVPVSTTYGTNQTTGAPLIPPFIPRGQSNLDGTVEGNKTGADERQLDEQYQVQLFSLNELIGSKVHAKGGEVGKIIDFIIHKSDDWHIRYIVIDTGGFLKREPVVVTMDSLKEVTWFDNSVILDVSSEKIESAPEHAIDDPLTSDYEKLIYQHYEQTPYWERT